LNSCPALLKDSPFSLCSAMALHVYEVSSCRFCVFLLSFHLSFSHAFLPFFFSCCSCFKKVFAPSAFSFSSSRRTMKPRTRTVRI
jgi:hypothetical protein